MNKQKIPVIYTVVNPNHHREVEKMLKKMAVEKLMRRYEENGLKHMG